MGKGATLALEVKPEGREPLFLALARALIADIERGRLPPGTALPGTRALAVSLGMHRNTVDAAYQDLILQGWLVSVPSRGTFVARDLPDCPPLRPVDPVLPDQEHAVRPAPLPFSLSDGTPDPRLAPVVALAQAIRRALLSPSFLSCRDYGDPCGHPLLREALALYLRDERGLAVRPAQVMITRGSQMALFLAARALGRTGAVIAVETPGYPLAWRAFQAAGVPVVGVPVDGEGLDVEALERLAASQPGLVAVYLTPHHQYPTTVTLGAARRLRLLDLARRHDLVIIEDDYDHEYRFEGRPLLPLAARNHAQDRVIHVGSLSKLIAPALRIGYAIAPPALLERMAGQREAIDRQGDGPLEQALGELLADGTLRRHARKARRLYLARRDRLVSLLRVTLADRTDFAVPAGGLAVWLRLRGEAELVDQWVQRAAALGLAVLPGRQFSLPPAAPPAALRLGFAALSEDELERAVEVLVRACPVG